MTDNEKLEREVAYQEYLNEITSNGNRRIDNMVLSLSGDEIQERHFMTQIDMAFQAAWNTRHTPDTSEIRNAALEEAAKKVETLYSDYVWRHNLVTDIRDLKTTPTEPTKGETE